MTGLALWLKGPVKRLWLANQTSSHVQTARELMKKQDWPEASRLLMEALRLAPDDAEVLRTFADLLKRAKANPSDQIQLLHRLVDRGLATPVDMTDLAGAHLRRGDIAAARSTLDGLPPSSRSSADARMIEAAMLQQQGQKSEAEAMLRQVLESQATSDPEARFKLAVLDFKQPHGVISRRGAASLWSEIRQRGLHRAEALGLLAQSALKPEEAAELVRLADDVDNKTRYAVITAFLRLHPGKQDETFQQEFQLASAAGEKGLVEFVRWLSAIGEHERMHNYLPPDSMVKTSDLPPELLNVKLTALARQGDWDALKELIQPELEKSLGAPIYHLWLARLRAREPDGKERARQHLHIAASSSRKGADMQMTLLAASVAAELEDWTMAADFTESAAARAETTAIRATLLEKAFDFHAASRDCNAMLATAREIASLKPGNETAAFRADYLALLVGESFETIAARLSAASVATAGEDTARHHLLQALTAYRLGSPLSKEALVKGVPEAQSWPPGHRAVFAALLALSGQNAAAFQLSERIQSSSLLPEEAKLMRLAR